MENTIHVIKLCLLMLHLHDVVEWGSRFWSPNLAHRKAWNMKQKAMNFQSMWCFLKPCPPWLWEAGPLKCAYREAAMVCRFTTMAAVHLLELGFYSVTWVNHSRRTSERIFISHSFTASIIFEASLMFWARSTRGSGLLHLSVSVLDAHSCWNITRSISGQIKGCCVSCSAERVDS